MLFHPTEITNMIYLNFFFKEKRILVIQAMAENAHDIFWSFFFYSGGHLWWCFWRVAFELVLCVSGAVFVERVVWWWCKMQL